MEDHKQFNLLIVDSSAYFDVNELELLYDITFNYWTNSLASVYADFLEVDTACRDSVTAFNKQFQSIIDSTVFLKDVFVDAENYRWIESSTLDSAFSRMEEIRILSSFSKEEVDSVLRIGSECWEEFHERFNADGYCRMTTPYFTRPDKAIVYFDEMTHALAGSSRILILEEINGSWKVVKDVWLISS